MPCKKMIIPRCGCCPTVLCDDDVGVGAAVLVDVLHGLLHTVHHLHAALQVAVLGPQRLGLRRAEGQVGGEAGAGVDLYLRSDNGEHCQWISLKVKKRWKLCWRKLCWRKLWPSSGHFTLSVRSMSTIWSKAGVLSTSRWISRVSMALHAAG